MSSSSVHTEEDWRRYERILRKLWEREKWTMKKIMEHMEQNYNFRANKNAYDRQFQAWGWRKNIKDDECYAAMRIVRKRKYDQNKQSEILLSGIVIDLNQRWKRQRLEVHEYVKLERNATPPLPSDIIVQTPPSIVTYDLAEAFGNLPSLLFFKNMREQILQNGGGQDVQMHAGHDQALSLGTELDHILLDIVPDSMDDLGTIAAFLGRILPSDDDSKAVLSLAYMLARGDQQIKDDTLAKLLSSIKSLGMRQGALVLKLIASVKGPIATSFILALLMEIFEFELSGDDNTDLARFLLPRSKEFLNLPIASDDRRRRYVDCLWSVPMAKLFISYNGNLSLARKPFQRLLERNSPGCLDLCKLFIENGHPDLTHASLCSHIKQYPTLVQTALQRYSAFDASLALAHAIENDDIDTETFIAHHLRRKENSDYYLPRTLAIAAGFGYGRCVDKLVRRGVPMDVPVPVHQDLYGESGLRIDCLRVIRESDLCVVTAVQFAIAERNFDIATNLINAGASALGPQKSHAVSPLQLALEANNAEMALQLLANGAISDAMELPVVAMAIGTKDESLIEKLLGMGADPNKSMQQIAGYRTTNFVLALENLGEKVALSLLKHGAHLTETYDCDYDCKRRHRSARAALSGLCIKENMTIDFVRSLNITKKDLNILHHIGEAPRIFIFSPLTWVMQNLNQDIHDHEVIQYLISIGADINLQGTTRSPFDIALGRNCTKCLEILLDTHGAGLAQEAVTEAAARYAKYDLLVKSLTAPRPVQYSIPQNEADSLLIHGPIDHNLARAALTGAIARWRYDNDSTLFFQLLGLEIDYTAACMTVVIRELCEMVCDESNRNQLSEIDLVGAITRLLQARIPVDSPKNAMPFICCGLPRERDSEDAKKSCLWISVLADKQHLVDLLLQHNADPNKSHVSRKFREATDEYYQQLRNYVYQQDPTTDILGSTPLHCAARAGRIHTIRKLISAGGTVHQSTDELLGRTVLQEAVEHDHLETVKFLLHEVGASPDEPAEEDVFHTALCLAADNGNILIAHELIKAGADVNRSKYFGRDPPMPLVVAAKSGHLDLVAYLINNGADIGYSSDGKWQFGWAQGRADAQGFPVIAKFLRDERERLHPDSESETSDPEDEISDPE